MDDGARVFEDIRRTELFDGLSTQGLDAVVSRLEPTSIAAGQTVVHRGDPGTSMFIILRGTAQVVLSNAEGWEYVIAALTAGDVFGEMALLTGEPRSASVKSVTELQVVEIGQVEFREMIRIEPEINTRLLRLLAKRLGETTALQQAEHWDNQELILSLLSYRQPVPVDHFPGRTQWAKQIDLAITHLAGGTRSVVILGEPGAGHELVAALIHRRAHGGNHPLFLLDCANPPPVTRDAEPDGAESATETLAEIAQEAALFGHEAGSVAFAVGTRRGYLELANGGTLILRNLEHLGPRVQARLLRYLETHSFTRIGGAEPRITAVRILGCSSGDMEAATARGEFDAELLAHLGSEVVRLKPLRKRKQDIPVLAECLLVHAAKKARRDVLGLSADALRALVDHEWPFNIDELTHAVERAVTLCDGGEVREEHLFLDISPFSTHGTLNLLRLAWINRLVRRRHFPGIFRVASVPAFLLVTLSTLVGPRENNLPNMFLWAVGWPALLLLTVLSARSWCSYCPLPPLSHVIGRARRGLAAAPRVVRKHGVWFAVGGVVAIVWAEHALHMTRHPHATGVLLLLILGGAVISTVAFGERTWCRHLCPLGQMVSQFAGASPIVLRGNSNVCLTQCETPHCVKDDRCPMGIHPSATRTSHDCILCFSCVRSCSHNAVHLRLYPPWRGILEPREQAVPRGLLPVLLVASVLALELPPWLAGGQTSAARDHAAAYPWLTAIGVLIFVAVTAGYVGLVAAASGSLRWARLSQGIGQVSVAYLPLGLAGFFNLYSRELVYRGHEVLPALVRHLGLSDYIPPSSVTANLGTLKALLPLITFVSFIASLFMLQKISDRCPPSRASRRAHQLILAATALAFLKLL